MSARDLHSQEHYGLPLKYDPEFKGPRKRRSCTDVICLFLFTIFLIAWSFIAFFAYKNGDPGKIFNAVDSRGRKCGIDSEVLNKPYLFFFDLTKCADPTVLINGCNTPQVCLSECPKQSWDSAGYLDGKKPFDVGEVQQKLICIEDGTKRSVYDINSLRRVLDDGRCARWYTATRPINKRCLPSQVDLDYEWMKSLQISNVLQLVSDATQLVKRDPSSNKIGVEIFDDISKSWSIILASLIVAMVFSLVYIIFLRWIAGILTWLSIIAVIALSITGAIFSFQRYQFLKNHEEPELEHRMLVGALEDISNKPTVWLVFSIILGVFALIIFLLTIFLRKRIVVAITLIKEGSKAVSSILSALFFPLLAWILQFVVIVCVVAVMVYLMTIGTEIFKIRGMDGSSCTCSGEYQNVRNGDLCDPSLFYALCRNTSNDSPCTSAGCRFYQRDQPKLITYFHLYNLFGFFWGIWYVSGLSNMILAGAFASWYWTFNKNDVPFFVLTQSVGRTIRYHLGTVAFGSLIIAICAFIRALIQYVENKLKKFDNVVVRAIFCCLKCFFWCLQNFLQFISKNAYIMCAIHGKNFCSSAKNAYNLLMRNVIRVVVLDKVTDFLFFIGKVLVTGCVVAGTYYVVIRKNELELHYNGAFPLVIIGIGSFIIASIFFGVYSMAVDTLFLCFLEDCERNDGSREKPYFMSKNLMRILGKRNKKTD